MVDAGMYQVDRHNSPIDPWLFVKVDQSYYYHDVIFGIQGLFPSPCFIIFFFVEKICVNMRKKAPKDSTTT